MGVLQAMRAGILDTLPASALDGLTAEDFRLLLNGSGEVNVHQLLGYTSFNDASGGDTENHFSCLHFVCHNNE